MEWFRFYHEALDDPKVQRLPGVEFRAAVHAAMAGQGGPFAAYIRPDPDRGRMTGRAWDERRLEVFLRDNYTCAYCQQPTAAPHCDHILPVSRGGSNELDNLTTACAACNLRKHAKTPQEWTR